MEFVRFLQWNFKQCFLGLDVLREITLQYHLFAMRASLASAAVCSWLESLAVVGPSLQLPSVLCWGRQEADNMPGSVAPDGASSRCNFGLKSGANVLFHSVIKLNNAHLLLFRDWITICVTVKITLLILFQLSDPLTPSRLTLS